MRRKLLVADDSPTIQRVIELTFQAEEYDVTCVADGQRAIDSILDEPPDVVVADIDMPEKSGYEVSSFVKHTPHLAHIPVVLLTGAFDPIDEEKATEAGADAVLTKPFEPRAVVEQVQALVSVPALVGEPSRSIETAAPGTQTGAVATGSAAPAESIDSTESVDEYLDRLDAAFASLGSASATRVAGDAPPKPIPEAPSESVEQEPVIERWSPAVRDVPVSDGPDSSVGPIPMVTVSDDDDREETIEPPPSIESVPMTAVTAEDVPLVRHPDPAPEPTVPVGRTGALPLADAFEELLATEQGETRPESTDRSADPVTAFDSLVAQVAERLGDRTEVSPAGDATDVSISDALVERVARRVVETMSEAALRETVADVVLTVADRLVREEIERIKGDAG